MPERHLAELSSLPETLYQANLVVPLCEYQGNSPRLNNLQFLNRIRESTFQNYGVATLQPQITVLTDNLFRAWCENGCSFPTEIEQSLSELIICQCNQSETQHLSVRRAYWTPEQASPAGPAYNDLGTPEEVIDAIGKHYQHACLQGWNKRNDVEVALNLQEFVNPPVVIIENGALTSGPVPFGGEAYFDLRKQAIVINTVCGDNRAITQEDAAVDSYEVKTNHGDGLNLEARSIAYKPTMYLDRGGKLIPITLPVDCQIGFAPLCDLEALKLAAVVKTLLSLTGNAFRIEFSAGRRGIYINEVLPYIPPETGSEMETAPKKTTGEILAVLKSPADVFQLRSLLTKVNKLIAQTQFPIIYLDPELTADTTQLSLVINELNKLVKAKSEWSSLVILCPGTATEHAFRALILQSQFTSYTVSKQKSFQNGDQVEIMVDEKGQYLVHNKTLSGGHTCLALDQYPYPIQSTEIGNKAFSLLDPLRSLNLPVPKAVCLSVDFFMEVMKHNGLLQTWFSLSQSNSAEDLEQKFQAIQDSLISLSPKVMHMFERLVKRNLGKEGPFVCRSSALVEDIDLAGRTFTGEFHTGLNLSFDQLPQEVLKVIRSLFNPEVAKSIWKQRAIEGRNILDRWIMPVLIMPQVKASCSGTVFHCDPVTRDPNIIVIEAQTGVGGVVGGEERNTLTVRINADTNDPISIQLNQGGVESSFSSFNDLKGEETILNQQQVTALMKTAKMIRKRTGVPHDTEWAYGSVGSSSPQLWFVQSREIKI